MGQDYFVVLQLPGGSKRKYTEGTTCPEGFRKDAAELVHAGKAKVISARPDTGAAEDIHWHVCRLTKYKTLIVMVVTLHKHAKKADILQKACDQLNDPNRDTLVVDGSDKFQLVAT